MATLKQVAEAVGVSIATVSRVLNHDDKISVSDSTKIKIFEIAEELNYTTLRKRKENIKINPMIRIGIVEMCNSIEQLEDPYYLLLRRMVEKECFDNNLAVISIYKDKEEYKFIGNDEIEGIIAIGKFNKKEIKSIETISSNIVFLDSEPNSKYDSVKINFRSGVEEALDYLLNLGHKEIGYIGSITTLDDKKRKSVDERYFLYIEYLKEKDMYNENYILDTKEMTSLLGYRKMNDFLDLNEKIPTAFFVGNDTVATGVLKALYEKGVKVPEDINIIGFNDTIGARHTIPPLTTISVHIEYLSESAVSLILEKINKNRNYAKEVKIASSLVIRETTAKVNK